MVSTVIWRPDPRLDHCRSVRSILRPKVGQICSLKRKKVGGREQAQGGGGGGQVLFTVAASLTRVYDLFAYVCTRRTSFTVSFEGLLLTRHRI